MSALRLNSVARRLRRRFALLAVVCALGGVVALEHSGMAGMHAPEMAAWCLAVLPGAAVLLRRATRLASPYWLRLPRVARPARDIAPAVQAPAARAGPACSLVLRL